MEVFRVQENVPDVYPRKSRDFQLLCNIFDYVNNGVKFDIDSIRDVTDTRQCNDRLLNHLQTKLGFFTDIPMNTFTQRTILEAFPYLLRNKGSRKGIIQAIYVFLKTQGVFGSVQVISTNKQLVNDVTTGMNRIANIYKVEVGVHTKYLDVSMLKEIMKYILPAGYIVEYTFYSSHDIDDIVTSSDTIKIVFVNSSVNDGVRLNGIDENTPISSVSTSAVAKRTTPESFDANLTDLLSEVLPSNNKEYSDYYKVNEIGDEADGK